MLLHWPILCFCNLVLLLTSILYRKYHDSIIIYYFSLPSHPSHTLQYPKGTPPLSPLDSTHNVPGTLRQVKEILRMAQLVKAEADEMREEAKRELELARREKHDAELLKKNAAQILKMAKERLSDSKSR